MAAREIASLIPGLVAKFQACRIVVIGDLILDDYLWGHVSRISPEAPVPILNIVSEEQTLGGAGNVVKNLRALGAEVAVAGVVGEDATGVQIAEAIWRVGATREVCVVQGRPSTRKTRLMSLEHKKQVFRFDQEAAHPIGPDVEESLLKKFSGRLDNAQAVLCSDYLKGVLTPKVLRGVLDAAATRGVPAVINPKGSDLGRYSGATVLIPNEAELAQLAGIAIDGDAWLAAAGQRVLDQVRARSILVTRGQQGMTLFQGTSRLDIPAVARSVYDVTGAGDTVASVFTLAIAAGADDATAARLANAAGGIVVGKLGTATVTPAELLASLA